MGEPNHIKPLTSLRFLAAMWVVIYAFWPDLGLGFVPNLVAKGYLGVELFFVLSGFILCHVYLQAFGEKRAHYGGFLWARLARVYPLHLATLIGVGALGFAAVAAGMSIDSNVLSWASLPANLFMVHAWGFAPEAGWNHPSWSISAEWFAYLAFPAFAWAAWRLRERPVVALAATLAGMMALYVVFERLAGFSLTEATIRWGALRIVPCFAYGCAAYLAWRKGGVSRPGLFSLTAAGLIALSAAVGLWDGVIVALFGVLILSLASLDDRKAGPLASPFAIYLGEISYSVYMVCVPWKLLGVNAAQKLTGAGDAGLHIAVWSALVLAVPVIAAISYHVVERPARRWMRGLAARRGVTAGRDDGARQLA